ncbi:nucleotidyltransferase domain-containing protein [Oscillatoria sp. CS-180]|uniref:nucleotidyltransferase family protein n=1 Tax=Oscillatoria sp. CS-180 TaxID=3021720 RepID=UPI002330FC1E|nr:nucleotidyltransferase domain-containing protein [Oscillatoria sp. CS-180]MDB9525398.1 nucleotidyltransferase domain-containing protein [Oscillatoria sp. CS-180]
MSQSSQDPVVTDEQLAYWQRAISTQKRNQQAAKSTAWGQVQQIAQCLHHEFGATRVIVFGSLARDRFTENSDIDLAVEGITANRYFEAVAKANEYSDRWVDLKPFEALDDHFRQRVLETGVDVDVTD